MLPQKPSTIMTKRWVERFSTVNLLRGIIAGVWLYHGLVPKLLFPAADELALLSVFNIVGEPALLLIRCAGAVEILIAFGFFLAYRNAKVVVASAISLLLLMMVMLLCLPQLAMAAFNPITTTVPLLILHIILLREVRTTQS